MGAKYFCDGCYGEHRVDALADAKLVFDASLRSEETPVRFDHLCKKCRDSLVEAIASWQWDVSHKKEPGVMEPAATPERR